MRQPHVPRYFAVREHPDVPARRNPRDEWCLGRGWKTRRSSGVLILLFLWRITYVAASHALFCLLGVSYA